MCIRDSLDNHLVHLLQLLEFALLKGLHGEQLVVLLAPHLENLAIGALVELSLGLEILAAEHLVDQQDLVLHDLYYISCIKIIIHALQLQRSLSQGPLQALKALLEVEDGFAGVYYLFAVVFEGETHLQP